MSGFLTALECTKFVFSRALPRAPTGKLTAGLRGPTSTGRGGKDPLTNSWICPFIMQNAICNKIARKKNNHYTHARARAHTHTHTHTHTRLTALCPGLPG